MLAKLESPKSINVWIAAMAAFAVILIVSSLSIGDASATTYYVSPSGSASWSSCMVSSQPCSASTAMANAQAGDTVNFLAGVYNLPCNTNYYEDNSLQPANSGTSGSPITFQAATGATVTLVGAAGYGVSCDDGGVIGVNGRNYITISGFIIDTSGYPAANNRMSIRIMNSASHVIIQNNELIGHTTNVSDNYGGLYLPTGASYITITNNKIHGWFGPTGGNGIGGMFDVTNSSINNNEIYNCNGHGILNKQGGGSINIYYNYIHDIGSGAGGADCLHIMSQGGESVNGINFFQNICANWGSSGYDGGGVHLDASSISSPTYLSNINVYNNVFYNSGQSEFTGTNNTGQFYNNIVQIGALGSSHQTFITKVQGGITSVKLTNLDYNCYYDPSGTAQWLTNVYGSSPNTYSSLSTWQAAMDATTTGHPDIHGYNTNPLFVNPSSGPAGFKLQVGSSCSNGTGGSMGAYITGNETIGTTGGGSGTKIPNPPSNLN